MKTLLLAASLLVPSFTLHAENATPAPAIPPQQATDPAQWRSDLAIEVALPAKQPYPALNGGAFDGPVVRESPDPLIGYRWKETKADDNLQIYTLRPVAAVADVKDAFGNLESATGVKPAITVKGTGSIRLDFGVESAAWLEFDSPDLGGDVQMSISEYNQPAVVNNGPKHPVKTAIPVKYGNTYRLELNRELYEGVRFGWIHVRSFTSQWHITGIRLVCQIKPANYNGSFSCSDTLLTKIWYTGAYGVKLNLMKNYFGAILMDRGDRHSWTGDAHPSQAAALVAFGNYDFIKKNIENTSGQDNGIRSYSLYWVLSLIDYFNYTGDTNTLKKYTDNACRKLDDAMKVYGTNPNLGFYGWDERLGAGFEHSSCQESQYAYRMLSIRAWKEFASAMGASGRIDLRDKYNGYANEKIALLRQDSNWYQRFGLHANADAVTTGLLNDGEKKAVFEQNFTDRVTRVSFSPFNQYFVIQALALMNKHDDALSSIRDLWGGMIQYGGTTFFEVYRPSWIKVLEKNDPVPNNQAGYTSLCHPWGSGVTKWLSEEVLGIKPTSPGFRTFDVTPHPGRTLSFVSGTTPTPHGTISASFNFSSGDCMVVVPEGTEGRIGIPKVEKTINAIRINGNLAWDGSFHPVAGIGNATTDSQFVYLAGVRPGSYSIAVSYNGVTPAWLEPQESWPARFIGEDSTTSGNWGNVYGKEGFVLCNYNGNSSDRTRIGANADWKVSLSAGTNWNTVGFNDAGWASAKEYFAYGAGPWGRVAGMPQDTPAKWIWSSNNDADNVVYFRCKLQADTTKQSTVSAPASARKITVACDDGYEVYLNGTLLGNGTNWRQADTYALNLTPGENIIAVKGINAGGNAALIAEIYANRTITILPTYISSFNFNFHTASVMNNASPLVWSAGTTDTRALAPDSSNTIPRNAACMFTDWATMSFTYTIAGEREYSIALYFLDWDDKGRRIAVEMMDAETLNQIAPVQIIGNFKGGKYLIYSYNKSARFRIHQVRGDNAVLSGIFFDSL